MGVEKDLSGGAATDAAPNERVEGTGPQDPERRLALQKMGVFAAFTAPAMMTLLVSNKATAESLGDPPPPPSPPPGYPEPESGSGD